MITGTDPKQVSYSTKQNENQYFMYFLKYLIARDVKTKVIHAPKDDCESATLIAIYRDKLKTPLPFLNETSFWVVFLHVTAIKGHSQVS